MSGTRVRKGHIFWPLVVCLLLADCTTKRLAVEHLTPPYVPHDVLGDAIRFTLAYNPAGATSISFGPHSRATLIALTIVALAVIGGLYRRTAPGDWTRTLALGLVSGGALGNLADRVLSARGVVDFIDIGVGSYRFWTFNVADIGISVGAALLAILLWREEESRSADAAPASSPGD